MPAYDLIVIGAGPGGYEAAAHAARLGKAIALIEKERTGGTCLNAGCIPTKTFLKSARLFADLKRGAAYGVETGEVRFNLSTVIARKNRIVGTLTRGIDAMLKRAGVERIEGHARLISRNTVAVDGRTVEGRNILIATGSRPAAPNLPGLDSPAVVDSTGIMQLTEAPPSLAIIGGGYIGLEFAGFFSAIGTEVTVIEMQPHIGGGIDQDVAAKLIDSLQAAGVAFRTACRVTAIEGSTVHYRDGAGTAGAIQAAAILNATGRVPVVGDLGLEDVGVDFDARGIRTSDEGRTSATGVWTCGDVTGRRMLAHAATREGIVAVNNMFGRRDRIRYPSIPAVIYTHPEIASTGFTEEELMAQGIEYLRAMLPMSVAGRYLVENEGGSGLIKVLAGKRHGEILGVHMAGDGASEFIVVAAAMMEAGLCAADMNNVVFPHPTVSEALKSALLELV